MLIKHVVYDNFGKPSAMPIYKNPSKEELAKLEAYTGNKYGKGKDGIQAHRFIRVDKDLYAFPANYIHQDGWDAIKEHDPEVYAKAHSSKSHTGFDWPGMPNVSATEGFLGIKNGEISHVMRYPKMGDHNSDVKELPPGYGGGDVILEDPKTYWTAEQNEVRKARPNQTDQASKAILQSPNLKGDEGGTDGNSHPRFVPYGERMKQMLRGKMTATYAEGKDPEPPKPERSHLYLGDGPDDFDPGFSFQQGPNGDHLDRVHMDKNDLTKGSNLMKQTSNQMEIKRRLDELNPAPEGRGATYKGEKITPIFNENRKEGERGVTYKDEGGHKHGMYPTDTTWELENSRRIHDAPNPLDPRGINQKIRSRNKAAQDMIDKLMKKGDNK